MPALHLEQDGDGVSLLLLMKMRFRSLVQLASGSSLSSAIWKFGQFGHLRRHVILSSIFFLQHFFNENYPANHLTDRGPTVVTKRPFRKGLKLRSREQTSRTYILCTCKKTLMSRMNQQTEFRTSAVDWVDPTTTFHSRCHSLHAVHH